MEETRIYLTEKEMPRQWYNIQPDLPKPLPPPLHPGTKKPLGPQDLAPIFPMGLIMQEVSQERYIEIPEEIQQIYYLWRPSPMYRAHRLERALGTRVRLMGDDLHGKIVIEYHSPEDLDRIYDLIVGRTRKQ